jgi:putative proteasome-type protease
MIAILSAGNLATTQSVVTELRQAAGLGQPSEDLHLARTLFDVAEMVGDKLREVFSRDGKYVEPYGDPSASFLVGGEIGGDGARLFEVYSAGNFVEASPRSCFLQIGETKYGKPILDRGLSFDSSLEHAAKLALLSFDATMRSNLSVGLPIDLLRYEAGSFSADNLITLEEHDAYWRALRDDYAAGLTALIDSLPAPPDHTQTNHT